MKNQLRYERLIAFAQRRVVPTSQYYEVHHIIPRSMGGSNDMNNLVRLTVKEHRHCHILLYRIYRKSHPNMIFAVSAFYDDSNRQRIAFRVQHPLRGWLLRAVTLTRAANTRAKGRAKTAFFNSLTIQKRRRIVGLG